MNVNPSSLILLKPGTAFTFDGISHPHLELFAIRFYGASLEELVGRVAPEGMRVISTAEPDRVSWMFDSLLTQLMQADASFHSNADAWVRVILLNLLRESRTRPDVQTMAEIQFVRCKALLERDFKSIEGVGDAAGRCHLNRDYLNRLFKRFAGTTAEEYLRRTRLNAGCRLLLATDRTLADISDEVGYSDAFSFSKAFKRHFGISPTLWRRADRRSG